MTHKIVKVTMTVMPHFSHGSLRYGRNLYCVSALLSAMNLHERVACVWQNENDSGHHAVETVKH